MPSTQDPFLEKETHRSSKYQNWMCSFCVLFGVAVVVLLLATYPMEMLAFLSLAYLATIPFAVRRFRAFAEADRARLAETEAREPATPAAQA